jgi:hypothetical protein
MEVAQFEPLHRPFDRTGRFITLAVVLALVGLSYLYFKVRYYEPLRDALARKYLDYLFTAEVENIGRVDFDAQGDLHLYDVSLLSNDRGEERLCFRAREVVISFNGFPLREPNLSIKRVDLYYPELFVLRYPGGDWNVLHIFLPRLQEEIAEKKRKTSEGDRVLPDIPVHRDAFPPNGVHIYGGIVHVAFRDEENNEVSWDISGVEGRIISEDISSLTFDPWYGWFYGGRIEVKSLVKSFNPFVMDLLLTIEGANVSHMSEGVPYLEKPVEGMLEVYLSSEWDERRTEGEEQVMAGYAKVSQGDIWEFPALLGVLNVFSLEGYGDRKIEGGMINFTMKENKIWLEQLDLIGSPMNLYGHGWIDLTGEELEIIFFPEVSGGFRKVPLVGSPVQSLLDLLMGNIVPVFVKGSWAEAEAAVDEKLERPENIRKLMEEERDK